VDQLFKSRNAAKEGVKGEPTSGNNSFDQTMSTGFDNLIKQLRAKEAKKQVAKPKSVAQESSQDLNEKRNAGACLLECPPGNLPSTVEAGDPMSGSQSSHSVASDLSAENLMHAPTTAEEVQSSAASKQPAPSQDGLEQPPACLAASRAAPITGFLPKGSPLVTESSAATPLAGKRLSTTNSVELAASRPPRKKQMTLPVIRSAKRTLSTASTSSTTTISAPIIGPWTCPRCTIENTKNTWSRAKCELCGFSREQATSGEIISIDV
jgi:hypothetical protein